MSDMADSTRQRRNAARRGPNEAARRGLRTMAGIVRELIEQGATFKDADGIVAALDYISEVTP